MRGKELFLLSFDRKNDIFSEKMNKPENRLLTCKHLCVTLLSQFYGGQKKMNDKNLIDVLRNYMEENHLSWTQVSRQLGVTQNTLTNWNKGGKISPRNRKAIVNLTSAPEQTCSVADCTARDTNDPITIAMLRVWGTLSERDKARVYMNALEYRDANPVPAVTPQPASAPVAPAVTPVPAFPVDTDH